MAVFFDGPAGSQVPASVIAAVSDCLANRNANDGGLFATSLEVGELVESARQAVADLLGCEDANSVVFGPNMTTLTFALSRALAKTWRAGDEIIVTRLDHDANVSPWVLAARDAGVHVHFIDVNLWQSTRNAIEAEYPVVLREIVGNPFRPVTAAPAWLHCVRSIEA